MALRRDVKRMVRPNPHARHGHGMVGTLRCKPALSLRADSGSRMLRIRDQDVAAAIVRHYEICGNVAAHERDIRSIDAVGHAERAASIKRVWRISECGV